jgi:hypothetical protein
VRVRDGNGNGNGKGNGNGIMSPVDPAPRSEPPDPT